MMETITEKKAQEKGTFAISMSFADDNGDPVTPNQVSWSLVDEDSNVINNRQDQSITPATTVTIVLSGDDLQIQDSEADLDAVKRYVVCQWTYDSSLGTDLPDNEQVCFVLENLKKVT